MTSNVANRLCACLQGASEHYKTLIEEYGALAQREDAEPALAELAARQPRDVQVMQTLDKELQAILGEWRRCGNVDEADRQRVQVHAARARELAQEVDALQLRIAERTQEARQEAEAKMAQARQGRATLRSYRAGQDPGASGRMDSQA